MSNETVTAEATKVKAPKVAKVKPAAKKAPAPETKSGEYGMDKSKDVPWCEKKVVLFRTLKALKATSPHDGVTAGDVVKKAAGKLTARDVRHYSYHAKAGGLVGVSESQEGRGYLFFLTKKGVSLDPAAELKAQTK